eukprot:COSAG01_NODE_5397_length_4289_cov_8.059427_1_plen_221_part_00
MGRAGRRPSSDAVSIGAVSTAVTLDLSARLTAPPRGHNSCTGGVPLREVCGRHRSARNAMEADVAAGTVGDQGRRSARNNRAPKKYDPEEEAAKPQWGSQEITAVGEAAEYEVERLLQKRDRDGHAEYLVKWLGYDDASWEPAANICAESLAIFEQPRKKQTCVPYVEGGTSGQSARQLGSAIVDVQQCTSDTRLEACKAAAKTKAKVPPAPKKVIPKRP